MIKKISISGFAAAALFIMISAVNKPVSSGAPSSSTGAPDEQTCGMTTCHDDNSMNSGTANLTIEVGKFGDNQYEGLPIKIKISDPGKIRFGFQVTALNESNKKVGQFVITDSLRTQIIGGKVSLPDRDYLTYTYFGTLSDKAGVTEWESNWKPTGTDKTGKVTFYVAAIAANNDGEDKGDFVYTTKASTAWENTLNTNKLMPVSNINVILSITGLTILNPHNSYIKTISISDNTGKLILTKNLKNSDSETQISLPEKASGIIIVTIQTASETITKKLFASHD